MFQMGIAQKELFDLTVASKKGCKESPWEWNMVMRHAPDVCVQKWNLEGLGVELPVLGMIQIVIWADDIFFLSRHPQEVMGMTQDFTDVLINFKMQWKFIPKKHLA